MGLMSRFLARRNWRRRARAYVAFLNREPSPDEVAAVAALNARSDEDHARWELRYARMALGQLTAERGALDDRVPALVAHEVAAWLPTDPHVGANRVAVAETQLRARIAAYRDALARRSGGGPSELRVARVLARFMEGAASDHASLATVAAVISNYASEASLALEKAFGRARLPEDVRPSEALAG